jgi:hypothetical protein
MNPVALEHAKERLERAKQAGEMLSNATSFADTRRAWSDFLLAASAIYSKLEQGAKSNPKSLFWFGTKKKERRDDELLSYIHHARNTDEHGLAQLTKESQWGEVTFPNPIGGAPVSLVYTGDDPDDPPDNFKMTNVTTGEVYEPLNHKKTEYLAVVAVTDERYGDTFKPPKLHLGEPIEVDEPLGIAILATEYLKSLIADAEKLVVP